MFAGLHFTNNWQNNLALIFGQMVKGVSQNHILNDIKTIETYKNADPFYSRYYSGSKLIDNIIKKYVNDYQISQIDRSPLFIHGDSVQIEWIRMPLQTRKFLTNNTFDFIETDINYTTINAKHIHYWGKTANLQADYLTLHLGTSQPIIGKEAIVYDPSLKDTYLGHNYEDYYKGEKINILFTNEIVRLYDYEPIPFKNSQNLVLNVRRDYQSSYLDKLDNLPFVKINNATNTI